MCKSASAEINRSYNIQGWSWGWDQGGSLLCKSDSPRPWSAGESGQTWGSQRQTHWPPVSPESCTLPSSRWWVSSREDHTRSLETVNTINTSPRYWWPLFSIQRDAFEVIYTNGSIFIIEIFNKNLLWMRLNTQSRHNTQTRRDKWWSDQSDE